LIFPVLIYIASLALQPSIAFNIYNQCQTIKLTSPVYFIHGGKWHAALDQKIDTNAIMRNHLELDSRVDILEGVLMYRLQRKYTMFSKFFNDESRLIQLLVVWRIEYANELYVRALLVEHDSELDEDKLKRLYQKHWYLLGTQVDPIERNWRLRDGKGLITTIETRNEGYKWDIFITEGKDGIVRPLWIDIDR
jgi:hypothetical protein